jgi:hypothetical protein
MAGEKEAAKVAAVEANAAQSVAAAAATVASVVEAAAADVAAAQDAAKDIAAAAIAAPLAQDVADLEKEMDQWESDQEAQHARHEIRFQEMASLISSLTTRVEALETPKALVIVPPALPTEASLIPPLSEEPIAEMKPAIVIEPTNLEPSESIPAVVPPKARTRFL